MCITVRGVNLRFHTISNRFIGRRYNIFRYQKSAGMRFRFGDMRSIMRRYHTPIQHNLERQGDEQCSRVSPQTTTGRWWRWSATWRSPRARPWCCGATSRRCSSVPGTRSTTSLPRGQHPVSPPHFLSLFSKCFLVHALFFFLWISFPKWSLNIYVLGN